MKNQSFLELKELEQEAFRERRHLHVCDKTDALYGFMLITVAAALLT